jgi:hypothetical protein
MIDVWLKIRDRQNLEFVLKHLNYWLATFSNRDKYRIYIYNEDINNLPSVYSSYKMLKRNDLYEDRECQNIRATVERSHMSDRWKNTLLALALPYFYLKNSEYLINVDADDIFVPNAEYYTNLVINIINQYNLPTLRYDYIYSHNVFDENRKVLPHHFAFGFNISHSVRMKNVILNITNNIDKYSKRIPRLNIGMECNLDILFTSFFQMEGNSFKYHTFITKECFYHSGFPNFELYCCGYYNGEFNCKYIGKSLAKPLHQKTILIE